MTIRDGYIDQGELQARGGDDSAPLMQFVPEPPPSHWGKVTSQSRTLSPAYLKFLGKEPKQDGRD